MQSSGFHINAAHSGRSVCPPFGLCVAMENCIRFYISCRSSLSLLLWVKISDKPGVITVPICSLFLLCCVEWPLSLALSTHALTLTHTLFFFLSLSLVCVCYFFFQHSNTPTRTHQCINTHHWTFNWLHSITISRSVPFPSFFQPVLCLCLSSLSPFLTLSHTLTHTFTH